MKNKILKLLAVSLAFAASQMATAAPVELITNGDFETGNLNGWTVTDLAGGSGSFFAETNAFAPLSGNATVGAAGGNFYALSDQTGPGTHVLSQSFVVAAGSQVLLSFDLFVNDSDGGPLFGGCGLDHISCGPNQFSTVDILLGGASVFDTGAGQLANYYLGVDPQVTNPNPYTNYVFDITALVGAGGTFQIRFGEVDNQLFLNMGVDNVSILAVPEPATLALLGAGLIGMGLRRRRQRI